MKVDSVVVGAGISGITLARRLAEEKGEKVLLVERKNHIGGFCYDYRDEDGVLIHKYGPHIFRTSDEKVYKFLSQYTEWEEYQHRVLAYTAGSFYPMPINLDTVNELLGSNYSADNLKEYFASVRTTPERIMNVKDAVESQVGSLFYDTFFKNYTEKQWGIAPEELPKEIIARIPIRENRDNRYFTDKYQFMPQKGYTEMLSRMLKHPNIIVMMNTDYCMIAQEIESSRVFYSGTIDEYYGYTLGPLPYRCVSFALERYDLEYYQKTAVVNYPNDYSFTRITEFKHFYRMGKKERTVIMKEYSDAVGEPSYPIPLEQNQQLYKKYEEMNDGKVIFIGRLGKYKYLSMDQALREILSMKI